MQSPFLLSENVAYKGDSQSIAGDVAHFAAIADAFAHTVATLENRLTRSGKRRRGGASCDGTGIWRSTAPRPAGDHPAVRARPVCLGGWWPVTAP